ncbi:hypothetical protein EVAR_26457_1 [Eumeta japonica]|uniref:Uncharacterized protein n=1 Tax=Eumeta variegata TaxID=151549 RepID=A0A4C1Z4D9_EUMVA|nr:hypothetical protein EVAR_26457_1 [Eumeta japonica]
MKWITKFTCSLRVSDAGHHPRLKASASDERVPGAPYAAGEPTERRLKFELKSRPLAVRPGEHVETSVTFSSRPQLRGK